ncbi:peptidoglycan bridge formation glycyltransferase FemA/FemB family protein [Candidatus Saccharibacteria bacterium]|nr:peptidoglycan bridge formation glycyltransferase FemA/FemB family protein [Candidatus Saccharibacteria bacterium]
MQKIPLQQTKSWENLQHDLNQTTFFISENDAPISSEKENQKSPNSPKKNSKDTSSSPVNYQMLILKKSTPLGPYFYLPYGPYLREKTYAKSAYKALNELEKRERVIFTRIEPQSAKNAAYWLEKAKKSKDLAPKETWVLNLDPPMEELYQNMKQNTRNLARNYQKKGLEVKKVEKTSRNLNLFYKMLQRVAKTDHFNPIEKPTLKAELNQPFASLFIAYYTPEEPKNSKKIPIAASLFFDDGDTRYYMQSGSDANYRKLPGTIAILIEAIKDAKAKNLKNFDFWGIAPENADKDHPWAGFTKFKKSFGGEEVDYAGTHDLIRKPLRYQLYKFLRKINRLVRRVNR